MKIIIATVLCAFFAFVISEDSILPSRSQLTGKMLKSINKIFSPSSSSSQDANAWIKSLAIVVIDEQQAIQCGGSIITTIMIVIPTGCWPNTLPSYSALVQHRLPEGGVKAYKLSSIVKTIPPAREVDIVQLAQGITFGESSVTGAFVEELLKNQFGEVKGKEPAYGVEIIKDQNWKPELKTYFSLVTLHNFIGLRVEKNKIKPAYPGEPLYQKGKLVGLYMREIGQGTGFRQYQYSTLSKDSWKSIYP